MWRKNGQDGKNGHEDECKSNKQIDMVYEDDEDHEALTDDEIEAENTR